LSSCPQPPPKSVDRAAHLFDLKYAVSQNPNGQYFLKVYSDRAIREPFLHFLIQVEWSGGRLIREYSALLDPPQWATGAPAEIEVPQLIAETPTQVPTAAEVETPPEAALPLEELPPIGTEPGGVPPVAEVQPEVPAATDSVPEALPPVADVTPTAPPVADASTAAPPAPEPSTALPPPAAPEPVTPTTVAEVPAEVAPPAPAEPAQMPVETIPVAPVEPAPAPAVIAEAPTQPAPAVAGPSEYGPVQKGDTLSEISQRVNTDSSISPQQVMMAMLRANPGAFINNNINQLRAGKILTIPDRDTMLAVSRGDALKEYRVQYDAWQEYKLRLAGSSRPLAVADSEPVTQAKDAQVAKKPAGSKADKGSKKGSGKAQPLDLLRIVRANLDKEVAEETTKTPGVETRQDAKNEQRKLNEKVATLEEAIESSQMQNKEMRDKVGKLQDQVKNTERLIDLENKDLAVAQKQAAEAQAKAAAEKAAAEKAEMEKAAADKAAADKAAADKAAADKAAADKAAADKAAADKAAADKAAEAPQDKGATPTPAPSDKPVATARKPLPPPPPVEDDFLSGILSSILDNNLTLALLGGVGLLLAGAGGFYFYRRRRASREFSESILSGSSISADASIMDTSGQAAASDTSFLSDFSQGGMGNVHTDEVDPIAEAEVYLAYGRDEQAEEILKDAIVKDPARQELKGKLLEIYFQRHDVSGFETLAEELYAQLEGKGGKIWDKAEEMGRKLSPGNPMFRGGKPAGAPPAAATTMLVTETGTGSGLSMDMGSASSTDTLLFEPGMTETPAATGSDQGMGGMSLDFEPSSATTEESSSLDMSLDFQSTSEPTEELGAASGGLDMNFSMEESGAGESGDSSSSIDFNLGAAAEPEGESSAGSLDFATSFESSTDSGLDFAPGGADGSTLEFEQVGEESIATETADEASLPGWDETATKLDLAKAYIDMGDSEGARSILDEVMAEGNDQQKQQARDLASQIAA